MDRKQHWERVYAQRAPEQVSWYQPRPERSLALIEHAVQEAGARIIDVGGGASTLVDCLLERGFEQPAVLDLSAQAIARAQRRLGARARAVRWFEADVTAFEPPQQWDVWHDRAVFHFLTDEGDRRAYAAVLRRALAPAGQVVISTFGAQGPVRCSGLDVVRYSAESLAAALGPGLALREQALESHRTPAGATQEFLYCRFAREAANGAARDCA